MEKVSTRHPFFFGALPHSTGIAGIELESEGSAGKSGKLRRSVTLRVLCATWRKVIRRILNGCYSTDALLRIRMANRRVDARFRKPGGLRIVMGWLGWEGSEGPPEWLAFSSPLPDS